MILLCIQTDTSLMNLIGQNLFLPILIAFVTYFLIGLRDEFKKRRMYSLLVVELLSLFIEEIETGLKVLQESYDIHIGKNPLPNKCWKGINTIPDEILLRIFYVTNKIPDKGFPAKEIRIHTKNYFENIIPNWDFCVKEAYGRNDYLFLNQVASDYAEATTKVLLMLHHVRLLLENNAKRRFPKFPK